MATAAATTAIRVRGLQVTRGGNRVLDGLDLDVAAGRITGLLGPSGSGKTTLMRAIVGVQLVAGGTVSVLGVPAGTPSLRSRAAYVAQSPSVYTDLTVAENLGFFARVLRVAPERVAAAIAAVDLGGFERRVVATLSGGERSRVSLAIALLDEPELLVLDEPTVGLDPVLRRDLWDLFRRLAEQGKTLLVSSHVMDEAERCDELLLLRGGRLLAAGAQAELLARTQTATVEQAFLALVEADGTAR